MPVRRLRIHAHRSDQASWKSKAIPKLDICMYSDSEAAAWNLAKCHPRDKRNWPKMQRLAEPEPSQ